MTEGTTVRMILMLNLGPIHNRGVASLLSSRALSHIHGLFTVSVAIQAALENKRRLSVWLARCHLLQPKIKFAAAAFKSTILLATLSLDNMCAAVSFAFYQASMI